MNRFAGFFNLLPQTDIQSQRLGAMNRHWSTVDGNDSLMSIAMVVIGLVLFFFVMKFVLFVVQSKSKERTKALRKKNRAIK